MGNMCIMSGCNKAYAILQYIDDCTGALDNKLFTISRFLDFSKAFDIGNKETMLRELAGLRFRGTINNYFRDYLSNR